jgi:uncharacterized protein YndB with AHSA1/START domain
MLDDIRHSIMIRAARDRVWQVLTEAGLVEEWLGCIGFVPQVGAIFYMQPDAVKRVAGDIAGATHCELEALDAPDRMRFSWFLPGTPKTHVEIRLSDNGDGSTTAALVHSGWDQFDVDTIRPIHDMLDGGWSSFVLPALRNLVETQA